MPKRLAVFGLVLLSLFMQATVAFAEAFPEPMGFVNDFAGLLSSETKQQLEQKLAQLEKESSIEIVVAIVDSLGGTTIDDYAARLSEAWEIGKKVSDNGVLFLVAPNDREMRIGAGYGLEPVLPDAKAGRILDTYVVPAFQEEDYDKGISEGVEAIVKAVHGEEVVLDGSEESEEEEGAWLPFFIGVIFLSYLSSFLSRSKRWWPGGIIGAVLGVLLGIFLASVVASILAAVVLGILGLVFDFILSKNYKKRKAGGLPTSWWSSGGGFFGSARGGSGGSGGSFGGFGGGSSGGGGASRGW